MTDRRGSMREQLGVPTQRGSRESTKMVLTDEERVVLSKEIEEVWEDGHKPFESKFAPSDMRQLALVAHNHMKPAMKEFIESHSEILKKFRITGTQTTMRMCKALWGEDDPDVEYGLTCTSGPLGGDAQIAALMCMEDLGALIFFVDPLSAHPHQADIDSLVRLANCGNVILCPNPTSAIGMMHTLKIALESGRRGMIPSFFETLESPAVEEYKYQQELALAAAVSGKSTRGTPVLRAADSMALPANKEGEDDEERDNSGKCTDIFDALEECPSEEESEEAPNQGPDVPSRGELKEAPGQGHKPGRRDSHARLHGIKTPGSKSKKKGRKREMVKKLVGKSLRKLGSSVGSRNSNLVLDPKLDTV